MTKNQKIITGVIVLSAAALGYYYYNKGQETTSNAAGSTSTSGRIPKGGYKCMDGNKPCSWQDGYCPCNLVKA